MQNCLFRALGRYFVYRCKKLSPLGAGQEGYFVCVVVGLVGWYRLAAVLRWKGTGGGT